MKLHLKRYQIGAIHPCIILKNDECVRLRFITVCELIIITIFSASLALKYSSWAEESGLTKNYLQCTKLRCSSLSRYCTNDPTGKKAAEVSITVFLITVKFIVTVISFCMKHKSF